MSCHEPVFAASEEKNGREGKKMLREKQMNPLVGLSAEALAAPAGGQRHMTHPSTRMKPELQGSGAS
jgi:hypothetical protein